MANRLTIERENEKYENLGRILESRKHTQRALPSTRHKTVTRTTEVLNTIESNPRKYNFDFSKSLQLSPADCGEVKKEIGLGKYKIREKVQNVLKINGNEMDKQQKQVLEDLVLYSNNKRIK
eukprot:TRINITY_DN18341_c0_g1_i1.p1 TRINITY_DN18341_c0_g1~~TRINITY_DN18341_c0_g1_i1.p1  ORF type:complete len:122 (-),score=20.23 TRINITY_DN18341_c0_g1_i1:138-503(-)